MKLVEWGVGGFKSFVDEQRVTIGDLNVLVGKNNSGKSNIIDSLMSYRDIVTGSDLNREWIEKRASGKEFDQKIRFFAKFELLDSELEQVFEKIRKRDIHPTSDVTRWEEKGYFKNIEHRQTIVPTHIEGRNQSIYTANWGGRRIPIKIINGGGNDMSPHFDALPDFPPDASFLRSNMRNSIWGCFSSVIGNSVESWDSLKAFREPDDQREVHSTTDLGKAGINLPRVLHTLRDEPDDRFETIAETYVGMMEGVEGIRTPLRGRQDTTVTIDEIGFSEGFDLDEISSGSKEILTLITKIVLSRNGTDILLLEEPELHLHPNAERKLFSLIEETVSADTGPQVILSTHSDVFVNESQINNIIRVDRDPASGRTMLQSIPGERTDEVLIDIGYDKSDLFQSSALVFVEGRSDQRILEEFARTLAQTSDEYEPFEELGVTLHPLGGDRMRKHGGELAHMAGRLRLPHVFVVDSDGREPERKREDLEEKLGTSNIKVLNKYCIESYLLEAPGAIADAFRYEVEGVEQFIEDTRERPNKKEVIKDLYGALEEGGGGYDEEQHGRVIARHMDSGQINNEIKQLIKEIQAMVNNSR